MGRLGLVVAPRRSWRVYAGPAALLLAATLVVALARGELRHRTGPAATTTAPAHTPPKRKTRPPARPRVYVVRAGDTIVGIAKKTGVPAAQLLRLNPNVTPTALFIGQRIRLR